MRVSLCEKCRILYQLRCNTFTAWRSVGHVSAACGASPVVSGLPLNPTVIISEMIREGKGLINCMRKVSIKISSLSPR